MNIKRITAITLSLLLLLATTVLAASTDILKGGMFPTAGFINAGEAVDGAITGPGNWTQLNGGDVATEGMPYLHLILKASGDAAGAQIGISDMKTYTLSELGITLSDSYQDVVLPVGADGIPMISWINLTGLDGGSTTYTLSDVFLSDSASPTIGTAEPATGAPKTGESANFLILALFTFVLSASLLVFSKKGKTLKQNKK